MAGGNLSGDLTAPYFPIASGLHTLVDSNLQQDGNDIKQVLDGVSAGWSFEAYNLFATPFDWKAARGTLDAPEASLENDIIYNHTAAGYDGAGFRIGAEVRAYVDGAPSIGAMPGRWEWSTHDDAGLEHVGMILNKHGQLSSEIELVIKKTTVVTRSVLTPVLGNVTIDCALSDFFSLEQTGDVTFEDPINAKEGRKFLVRILTNGSEIGFGSKWRFAGAATPDLTPGAYQYLGVMYNEDADTFDVIGSPVGPFIP